MYLIFSLDTEDFITVESDEAVKFWAEIFLNYKVKASFNLVAERARVLRRRGRRDIINILKNHEINYHSNLHSVHPTFPEYLENRSWEDGVREVIKKEIGGLTDIREIFGKNPIAFMQPGSSGTPQVIYAMKLLGIPVMEWTPFVPNPKRILPFWYCYSLHGLHWHFIFDKYYNLKKNRLSRMKEEFKKT